MLAQSLDTLDKQWSETVEHVAARQQELDDQFSQWIHFDDSYQKLISAFSVLHTSIDATDTLTAEDAIVRIEKVSV